MTYVERVRISFASSRELFTSSKVERSVDPVLTILFELVLDGSDAGIVLVTSAPFPDGEPVLKAQSRVHSNFGSERQGDPLVDQLMNYFDPVRRKCGLGLCIGLE